MRKRLLGRGPSSDGSEAALRRLPAEGVEYSAKLKEPGRWCAEWKIPFASLAIDPKAKDRKYLFNLSVRKTSPREWVIFRKPGGPTWEVSNGAYLQVLP